MTFDVTNQSLGRSHFVLSMFGVKFPDSLDQSYGSIRVEASVFVSLHLFIIGDVKCRSETCPNRPQSLTLIGGLLFSWSGYS